MAAASSSASVVEVSETSVVAASTSISVETTTSTSTGDSTTATLISETTSSSTESVSSIYETPSTTYVVASTTPAVVSVTSTVTQSPASTGGTGAPSVVIITSTAPPASTAIISTPSTSAASSTPSALSASGSSSSKSSGLSTGGTIAIAVVIPIVAIALLFCLGLFLWRRRKQRKVAEEQRKAEIEDYGFNPNQDPTLATAAYAETGSEMAEDNNGYRGWGTTSSAQRKPSTTLGSGSRNAAGAAGPAMSESSSTAGGNAYTHPPSDETGEGTAPGTFAGAAAGGATGAAATRRRSNEPSNIHRGPSNASSAYSAGPAHNDLSEELPGSGAPAPYYHEEGPYNYIDAQAQQGPWGDGTYHPSGQPVIRNVQARRNTRIERAPTQPNVGIAQNF